MRPSSGLPALALAAILAGCASTGSNVEKEFYSPSHPKYSIGVDKQGRKEGPEVWWYQNGKKKYEAVNHAGVRDGKFTGWYENGTLWYRGFESHGKPESTLTYWNPNGKLKSQALFRDGIQLERKDFDAEGRLIQDKGHDTKDASEADAEGVSVTESARLRKAGLQVWGMRVRQTVESYWVLPKQFAKARPYRAVAKIKVGRDGKILGVTWLEKSPSAAFNSLASATFKRIKRLPPFPPQITDQSLEVQYEFISLGKRAPRKKLETREDTPK
jgi:hypothetical protein